MPAGEITSAVTVPSGITLLGAAAGKNAVNRAAIATNETIISAPLAVGDNVSLDGFTLTANITAINSSALTVKNTIFKDIVPTVATHVGQSVVTMTQWTQPIKLIIENSYFGANNGVYNVFELNAPLADGTSIVGNHFAKEAGSHNIINIYAMTDNAIVTINDNYFEYSGSALRIGTTGAVQNAAVNFSNNIYVETDITIDENVYEEINIGDGTLVPLSEIISWGGFTTIQSYGTQTKDMSGITLNYVNNSPEDAQMYVYYSTDKATFLDMDKRPVIIINGEIETDEIFYGLHTLDVRTEI